MKNNLKISKEISLPPDTVTQTIAILAKRRAGKSYTMRKMAEQLFKANQQIVIVDPKGDQWGIRSSADGKKPGLPVVIFGGEHGDVPLEPNAGEMIAKLVVEERVSILIDLSMFRKYEVATFMTAFLENLYRLKAQEQYRTPVMLIIDEADAIAPQKPQKGEERMLGAAEDIVRRGGQRGLGCTLVTQRSAVLNKNVLTQAEMLVVLRTIAPQDIAAMKAWIDVHGSVEEGKVLIDSLPSLPIGDAWFWSPGWPTSEGIFKRTHVLPITTFDSGATPKPGEKKIVPKNLADVNLDALKKQMASVVEKAKENDPKALKKQIADLQNELKKKVSAPFPQKIVENDPKLIKMAVDKAVYDVEKKYAVVLKKWKKYSEDLMWIISHAEQTAHNAGKPEDVYIADEKVYAGKPIVIDDYNRVKMIVPVKEVKKWTGSTGDSGESKPLSKCARAILTYLRSVYPKEKSQAQMWIATGYAPGGTFRNCIYELTGQGLIAKTQIGYSALESSNEDFDTNLSKWDAKLSLCARKIFALLLDDHTTAMTKDELAAQTGYQMGGTFRNCIYELTGVQLIIKSGGGYIVNPEALEL